MLPASVCNLMPALDFVTPTMLCVVDAVGFKTLVVSKNKLTRGYIDSKRSRLDKSIEILCKTCLIAKGAVTVGYIVNGASFIRFLRELAKLYSSVCKCEAPLPLVLRAIDGIVALALKQISCERTLRQLCG